MRDVHVYQVKRDTTELSGVQPVVMCINSCVGFTGFSIVHIVLNAVNLAAIQFFCRTLRVLFTNHGNNSQLSYLIHRQPIPMDMSVFECTVGTAHKDGARLILCLNVAPACQRLGSAY